MACHWVRMGLIAPVDGASSLKVRVGEFVCRLRDKGERDVSLVPSRFGRSRVASSFLSSSSLDSLVSFAEFFLPSLWCPFSFQADFRASDKVIYRITPEGASSAWINNPTSQTPSYLLPRNSFSSHRSSVSIDEIHHLPDRARTPPPPPPCTTSAPSVASSSPTNSPSKSSTIGSSGSKTATPPQAQRQSSDHNTNNNHNLNSSINSSTSGSSVLKDSNAAKLHRILEEPALRSLFRQHMRYVLDLSFSSISTGDGKKREEIGERENETRQALTFVSFRPRSFAQGELLRGEPEFLVGRGGFEEEVC